ncbi:hypothetical protein GQ53DRAFT_337671 [Thozetella sp. PMI_491]|nr:hypothetical protein GQ53DRAFT_337671 [Thozetella sp. PMI_491]
MDVFHAKKIMFNSWVISMLGENKARKQHYWLFLVLPGAKSEWCFPREGDSCKVQLYSKSGVQPRSMLWEADHRKPLLAPWPLGERLLQISRVPGIGADNDGSKVFKPLLKSDEQTEKSLMTGRATRMRFELSYSSATMRAELEALDRLTSATSGYSEKQRNDFRCLTDFKNPASEVNLFDSFPWIAMPRFGEFKLPAQVTGLYRRLNDGQRTAYRQLLSSMPCGIESCQAVQALARHTGI